MPLMAMDELEGLLACPVCQSPLLRHGEGWVCSAAACPRHTDRYRCVGITPVLIDFGQSVFTDADLLGGEAASINRRTPWRGVHGDEAARLAAEQSGRAQRAAAA